MSSRPSRVTLRPLTLDDASIISAYRSHPDVARYQSWEIYTLQDAESLCIKQQSIELGTPGSWSQFAIVMADTGELIGDCGLHFFGPDEAGFGTEIEIGITLAAHAQGRGLASEAIACIVETAFARLGKRAIRASIDARNVPAAGLLARAGFIPMSDQPRRAWFKGAWCEEWDYVLKADRARDPLNAAR